MACELIRDAPSWLSQTYHFRFTKLLRLAGIGGDRVAFRAAWNAYRQNPTPDGQILLAALDGLYQSRGEMKAEHEALRQFAWTRIDPKQAADAKSLFEAHQKPYTLGGKAAVSPQFVDQLVNFLSALEKGESVDVKLHTEPVLVAAEGNCQDQTSSEESIAAGRILQFADSDVTANWRLFRDVQKTRINTVFRCLTR